MTPSYRAGSARLPFEPPLGLPMVGFVRQPFNGEGYGWPLEMSALVVDAEGTRVVLCGVDVVGIVAPEIETLIARVAAATGAPRDGVLLNWSHTHLAPTGGTLHGALHGDVDEETARSVEAFVRVLQDKIVSVCALAADRLEPAEIVWGQDEVDLAVNRRERTQDGYNGGSILGWNPDELVDNQVTVLQARRADESVIGTLVGFGCHPVTTGYDMSIYSADFPGPMRDTVARATDAVCVFFQGAGGNVLPRFAFTDDEREAERMGRRLGLAALHAVADRTATPFRITTEDEGSVTPITRYRRAPTAAAPPAVLRAASAWVDLPLQPHPTLEEIAALREAFDAELQAARASGDRGRVKVAFYQASWARRTEDGIRDGTAATSVRAPVHAVRIGDGVIVTGPGETFSEIGMAVKERAPGRPTLYVGYTNEMVGYLPTAAEYAFGGYEAGLGYRSVGLPSHYEPAVEHILVETGVRVAERLFPEATPWDGADGWLASGRLPTLPPVRLVHPSRTR